VSAPRLPATRLLPFDEVSEGAVEHRRVFSVRSDVVRSRSQGLELKVDRILAPHWVNVVALCEHEGREHLILVRQWRFGQSGFSVALPGGIVDDGESFLAAGLRELLEETGYAPSADAGAHEMARSHPNPALFTNLCGHLLAPRVELVALPSPDEVEELEVLLVPVDELDDVLAEGHVTDPLGLAALLHWRLSTTGPAQGGVPPLRR
jgi:ADP-ribose pyrophosphatase